MSVVEKYYTVTHVSLLLEVCTKTVIAYIKRGNLGHDVVNLGSSQRPDYRIPARDINSFLDRNRIESAESEIAARTPKELEQKVQENEDEPA